MRRIHIPCLLLSIVLLTTNLRAQVGVGTTTPNPNAALDVSASDKGLLPPRLNTVQASTLGTVLGAGDAGMVVYNTSTLELLVWDGTQWVSANASGLTAAANGLTNNSGTVELGGTLTQITTIENDGYNLLVTGSGRVGIGTVAPSYPLTVSSSTQLVSIAGINDVNSGVGVYGMAIGPDVTGVLGTSTNNGRGVFGENTGSGIGVRAYNSGSGVALFASSDGSSNSVRALEVEATGTKSGNHTSAVLNNLSLSTAPGAVKRGLVLNSTGGWSGAGATNIALDVNVSGAPTNYAALFNGGNVGIGTTTPVYPLDVAGDINLTGILRANGSAGNNGDVLTRTAGGLTWAAPTLGVTSADNGLMLNGSTVELGGTLYQATGIDLNANNFSFVGGNVGIGTNAPGYLLTIDGLGSSTDEVLQLLGTGSFGSQARISFGELDNVAISEPDLNEMLIEATSQIYLQSDRLSLGTGALAVASGSIAIGQDSYTENDFGVAIGREAQLGTGTGSVAIGALAYAKGDYATALGPQNEVYNSFSTGIGYQNVVNSEDGFAFGRQNSVNGIRSMALGVWTGTSDEGSFVLGKGVSTSDYLYNYVPNSLVVSFNTNKPTLFVGPGTGVGTYGNIGIRTTTPNYALDINGDLNVTGELRANGNFGAVGDVLRIGVSGLEWNSLPPSVNSAANGLSLFGNTAELGGTLFKNTNIDQSSNDMSFTNGNFGIGTNTPFYSLDVNGDLNLTGELRISGNFGSPGDVLSINAGGAVEWAAPAGGGLTDATNGLTNNSGIVELGGTLGGNVNIFQDGNDFSLTGGNVGIGTNTPSTKLDVDGNANVSGEYRINGNSMLRSPNITTIAVGLSGTSGNESAYLGYQAGNTYAGNQTTAVGAYAGRQGSGNFNTFLGVSTGYNAGTGSGNTMVGYEAGYSNFNGNNNTLIGRRAEALANVNNATALGYNAKVNQSNSIVLGGLGADAVNVGIGTSAPAAPLQVVAPSPAASNELVTRLGVADAPNDYLELVNGIGINGNFQAVLVSRAGSHNFAGFTHMSQIDNAFDAGGAPAMQFDVRRTSNNAIVNRPLFHWSNNGSAQMVMGTNGNLGLGTTNPLSKFQIGNGSITGYMGFADAANLGFGTVYFGMNAVRNASDNWLINTDGANNGGNAIYGNISGDLRFVNVPTTGNTVQNLTNLQLRAATAMTLSRDRNLGLGMSDVLPNNQERLQVWGNEKVLAQGLGTIATYYNSNNVGNALSAYGNTDGTSAGGFYTRAMLGGYGEVPGATRDYGGLFQASTATAGGSFASYHVYGNTLSHASNPYAALGGNGTAGIFVNGNVGIGIANPTIRFQVRDAIPGAYLAAIQNIQNSVGASGLLVSTINGDPTTAVLSVRRGANSVIEAYGNNRTAIGTTTLPTSTLLVGGSLSTNTVDLAANTVLNETHNTVFVTAAATLTLPAANTCPGRIYRIKKTSTNSFAINLITAGGNIEGVANYILYSGALRGAGDVQSDGTNWWVISRTTAF